MDFENNGSVKQMILLSYSLRNNEGLNIFAAGVARNGS